MESVLKSGNGHIKIGLFVGAIGFLVVAFITFGKSLCGGLFCSIGMGALAGFLTSRYANVGTKENASQLGSTAGAIAGVFALLGQVLGGLLPSIISTVSVVSGAFPEFDSGITQDLFSIFFFPSLINGIIGLIAAGIAGSIAASKSFSA